MKFFESMDQKFSDTLKKFLIVGNAVFVLWIIYNGIDEGFSGTIVEKFSFVTLLALLLGNIFMLSGKRENKY